MHGIHVGTAIMKPYVYLHLVLIWVYPFLYIYGLKCMVSMLELPHETICVGSYGFDISLLIPLYIWVNMHGIHVVIAIIKPYV